MRNTTRKYTLFLGVTLTLCILVMFASASRAETVSATLVWPPNQEDSLDGYKIYYGSASRSYSNSIDIGNPIPIDGKIQGTVTGLTVGTTYYFAVTAYDALKRESDYSAEVVWTATLPKPPTPVVTSWRQIK